MPRVPKISPPQAPPEKGLVQTLLDWFGKYGRDLPWRKTRDPYAIWISEIMLQQTQVRTVIPYWERWMRHFPNPSALAQAPEALVLKLWEGLGYYRRARNLQKAAQQIVELHGGQFPTSPEEILDLPGVGRYTLGAIGSIAFNLPLPVLDGNVIRVLSRLWMQSSDPTSRSGADWYWSQAESLVRIADALPARHQPSLTGNCSALNQSLMELGATVCTPRAPQCILCPIQKHCVAFQNQRVDEFPPPKARPTITQRQIHAWIVLNPKRTHILLRQRPAQEINGGFWEFPELEITPTPNQPSTKRSSSTLFSPDPSAHVGFAAQPIHKDQLKIKHGITRYRFEITATLHEPQSQRASLPPPAQGLQWIPRSEMDQLPMTTAHRKLAESIPTDCNVPGTTSSRRRKS